MVLSLKPERLKRYKDVVALLVKYGRSDLVEHASTSLLHGKPESTALAAQPKADELADDLEKLGPTFVKLGPLPTPRGHLLPQPYLNALARLQDHIQPLPYEEVGVFVSSELGAILLKLFLQFDSIERANVRTPFTC